MKLSDQNNPWHQIALLKKRIEILERRNPLNNASIDPDLPGISAGSNVFNSAGFQFMWGGELRSMGSVASGLNNKADAAADAAQAAMNRANQAYDAQAAKPTTLWVQAQINNLQSQIDGAATPGDVSAVQTELTNFKIEIIQFLHQLVDAVEFKPGETPPPLPTG